MLRIQRWDGTRVLLPSSYASPAPAEAAPEPLAQSTQAQGTQGPSTQAQGQDQLQGKARGVSEDGLGSNTKAKTKARKGAKAKSGEDDQVSAGGAVSECRGSKVKQGQEAQAQTEGVLQVVPSISEPKRAKKRKQGSVQEDQQPPEHSQELPKKHAAHSAAPLAPPPGLADSDGGPTTGAAAEIKKKKKKKEKKPKKRRTEPVEEAAVATDYHELGEAEEGGREAEKPEDEEEGAEEEDDAPGSAVRRATSKGPRSLVGAPEATSFRSPQPGAAQQQQGTPNATVFGSAALGWMRRPRIISSALEAQPSAAAGGPSVPTQSAEHKRTAGVLVGTPSSAGGAISSVPLGSVPHLDPRLADVLTQRLGAQALFPVQAAVWAALSPRLEAHQRHSQGPGPQACGSAVGEGVARPPAGFLGREGLPGAPLLHDLCVCAPTGSGKTLAYALPIVQSLLGRAVRRVRALIVVPTRSLAEQVKSVLDLLAPAVGLSVGLAAGLTSLAEEAAMLQGPPEAGAHLKGRHSLAEGPRSSGGEGGVSEGSRESGSPSGEHRRGFSLHPAAGPGLLNALHSASLSAMNSPRSSGGVPAHPGVPVGAPRCRREGGVDILIATPGRLVEHLSSSSPEQGGGGTGALRSHKSLGGCDDCDAGGGHNAPALCLHDLAFLVVDEADRLLRQSYQDWLPRTLAAAARPMQTPTPMHLPAALARLHPHLLSTPTGAGALRSSGASASLACVRAQGPLAQRLVKVVLSATLTRDPSKLTRLRLTSPLFISTAPASAALGVPTAAPTRGPATAPGTELDTGPGAGGGGSEGGDAGAEAGAGEEAGGEAGGEAREAARYGVPQNLEAHMLVCRDVAAKPPMLAWLLRSLLCPGHKLSPAEGEEGKEGADGEGEGTSGETGEEEEEEEGEGEWGKEAGEGGGGGDGEAPQASGRRVLVFAASTEAAHRLALLLSALPPHVAPFACCEYSSLQPQKLRRSALERFRRGEVQVLVSTDGMTRGMDIGELQSSPRGPTTLTSHKSRGSGQEGHTGVDVVSYDAPVYPKTLLHRMGRTARAGRAGQYYTLLRKEEARYFKQLWGRATSGQLRCRNMRVAHDELETLLPHLVTALDVVKTTVQNEA